MNRCERCGKQVDIEDAFTITRPPVTLKQWALRWLCEPCVDTLLLEHNNQLLADLKEITDDEEANDNE